jgi:hypothetical protein
MSATVLRELVAKLGFQVDDAQFKRAAAGVEKIKTSVTQADARVHGMRAGLAGTGTAALAMGNSARVAGASVSGLAGGLGALKAGLLGLGLGALSRHLVGLASDANETDNVLSEVFGAKGSEEVKAWAETMGKEMGRSRYALRANAAALGAMLEPMTGSSVKAQEMSTHLAALAVDLGSFFNASDDDALAALKSGISGEAEPLKKFGIVLQDATLQEYAHAAGIKKKLTAMSVAEKTELRYGFILAHTTKAQGDAARTGDGYANATKRLGDNIKDLGTSIGQKLLPIANKLVTWSDRAVAGFGELARKSYVVESAMAVLAAAAAAYGLTIAAPFVLPAIAILGLIVALDELHTMFAGGKTALGDWLDESFGLGTTDKLVTALNEDLKVMRDLLQNMPDLQGWKELAVGALEDVIDRVVEMTKRITPLFQMFKAFGQAVGLVGEDFGRAKSQGMGAELATADEEREMRRQERWDAIRRDSDAGRAARAERVREARYGPKAFEVVPRADESYGVLRPSDERSGQQVQYDESRELRFGQARIAAPAPPTAAERAANAEAAREAQYGPKAYAAVPDRHTPRANESYGVLNDESYGVLSDSQQRITAPVSPPAAAAPSKTVSVTNGPITINIGAGVSAAEAGRAARQAADAERRRTGEALKRGA